MPVSLRELFLIVRAEDHASKQLRMVGGSLRALGKESAVAEQRMRMQNRAAAMQAAIAQRQARIGAFPAEEKAALAERARLTEQVGLAEQNLAQARATRGIKESDLNRREMARMARLSKMEQRVSAAAGMKGGGLASHMRAVNRQLDAERLARYDAGIASLDAQERRLALSVMAANNQLGRQAIGMSKMSSAHDVEKTKLAEDVAAYEAYNKELQHFERTAPRVARLQRIRSAAQGIAAGGRTAMFAGGIAAAGIGFAAAGAARLATQSSLAATQAVSSIEQVGKRTQQVQSGILKQMQQFPASADEMSQAIYDIFSGTNIQQANKGLKLMALFNKAAVAGQSDLNTATQGGITVMNAYGLQVKQMPGIMNKMFSAVRFGRTNFTDFNNSLNQLVPAFKSANQSINVMFGSLAFLTRRMPSVRMASTSLARATEILANPTMVKGLKKVGVSIADVHGNLLPLPQVISNILQKFPSLAKGKNVMAWIKDISNQQGTIQARRALTFLFRQFPQYSQMLKQVSGDTNEFNRSWKALKDTPAVQLQVAINQFKALALTIGQDAIPGIINLVKPLREAVKWFDKLPGSTKSTISTFLVYGAALALVGGALTTVVANLVSLYTTLRIGQLLSAGGALKSMSNMAKLLGLTLMGDAVAAEALTASLAAMAPYLAIGAVVALAAAWLLFGKNIRSTQGQIDDMNDALDHLSKNAKEAVPQLNKVASTTEKLRTSTQDYADTATKFMKGDGKRFGFGLSMGINQAKGHMQELDKIAQRTFADFVKIAEEGKKLNKVQAGQGAASMAKFAGLSAQSSELVSFASRMTGKLPTTDMLGAIKTFGAKAAVIFAQVAQSAHHMMTGHELDNAVALNQKHLVKLITFVQRHHRLPKWFLTIDARKAQADTKKVHGDAKKLGRDAVMMKVKANVAEAESKFNKVHQKAIHITKQEKYVAKIDANIQPLLQGLTTAEQQSLASGARAAAAFMAGWDTKTKSHSPSKEFEKRGRWVMQGIKKGLLKEAGGMQQAMKSIVDTMAQTWTSLHDTMAGFQPLFGGPKADIISTIVGFGAKPGIGLLTQDMRGQLTKMKQWTHAMHQLAKVGAPPAMLAQLWQMGPDALPEVLSILQGTKRQRNQYFNLFRQQQKQINRATRGAFGTQLKIWDNMGKRAAFGILTGLHEVEPQLIKLFKHIAKEMFHPHHAGGGGSGKKSGGKAETHYHYHAPAYVAGTSHVSWMKKSRFDFERHVGKLPRTA